MRERHHFLEPGLRHDEQTHRRAVLLGIATLITLTAAPVFGHHVAVGADSLLAGRDHIGTLCLIALHHLLAPVHGAFHTLVLAGLAYAAFDRLRAWWRLHTVLRPLAWDRPQPGGTFRTAATAAGLDPRRVRIVDGLPNPAFTTGLWRPVVYVARSLERELQFDELVAVLAHEGVHVRRRDPLRLSAVRFVATTLFWLPALARLADDLADQAELTADDEAAGRRPLALAAALLSIATTFRRDPLPDAAVGAWSAGDTGLLERRIRRLAGQPTPVRSHLTLRSIWLAGAALVLLLGSSVAVVHPLPAPGAQEHEHCTRHGATALSHLFCRHGAAGADCPHSTAIHSR